MYSVHSQREEFGRNTNVAQCCLCELTISYCVCVCVCVLWEDEECPCVPAFQTSLRGRVAHVMSIVNSPEGRGQGGGGSWLEQQTTVPGTCPNVGSYMTREEDRP